MSRSARERVIQFEGAVNVRDLGGINTLNGRTTRFGVIYRGDGLAGLTDSDLVSFNSLSIRSVIDLRGDDERERAPDRFPIGSKPEVLLRGFMPQGSLVMMEGVNKLGADAAAAAQLMRTNYARIPFEHTREFRDIMHFIIDHAKAPHFVHCSFGKDRTGIVAAFILRALDVHIDDVVADFEMTKVDMQALDLFDACARQDAVEAIMAAPAEYVLACLDAIDTRYGDFNAYLDQALDFGQTERDALASLLLE
jgi:protein-tyrosine phosphatase